MKRFLRSGSFKTLMVIAIIAFLGIICAAVSHNASSPFTSAIGTVFSPLQQLSSSIAGNLDDVSASFKSSSVYKAENAELKKELEEYRRKLADYDELKSKITAYEEFYGIKQKNEDFELCYAGIISRDSADPYKSFVLNCGSGDGVEVGDPVISGEYVVGTVKKVNYSTCVVYSVIDQRINIGAYESGTGEYGYICGEDNLFEKGLCKLNGLDSSTSVISGGIVCTSGAGGVFPGGLIVGEVTSVKSDDVSAGFYAEVKPYAELDQLTDVFVITSFAGQGEGEIK
jgi:rod shape-determining protein MreC